MPICNKTNLCPSYINLGTINFCGEVCIGIAAPETGFYTIEIQKGQHVHKFKFGAIAGNELCFQSCFNLGKQLFSIRTPSGYLEITKDGCDYTVFEVEGVRCKEIVKEDETELVDTCAEE